MLVGNTVRGTFPEYNHAHATHATGARWWRYGFEGPSSHVTQRSDVRPLPGSVKDDEEEGGDTADEDGGNQDYDDDDGDTHTHRQR